MKNGKEETYRPNQRPGTCRLCKQPVPALEGILLEPDPWHRSRVAHRGPCPPKRLDEQVYDETPLWSVPAKGRTPAGLEAEGRALVWGERPEGGEPVNAAAQRAVLAVDIPDPEA